MIKIRFTYIFIFFILCSCDSSNKDKGAIEISKQSKLMVKEVIDEFLKDTLFNYQNLISNNKIKLIDSAFNDLVDDTLINKISNYNKALFYFDSQKKLISEKIESQSYYLKDRNIRIHEDTSKLRDLYIKIRLSSDELIKYASNFKRTFIGWQVEYKYEIKETDEKSIEHKNYFILSPNFQKVLIFRQNKIERNFNLALFEIINNKNLYIRDIYFDIYKLKLNNK